jgi:hypothetical protein
MDVRPGAPEGLLVCSENEGGDLEALCAEGFTLQLLYGSDLKGKPDPPLIDI